MSIIASRQLLAALVSLILFAVILDCAWTQEVGSKPSGVKFRPPLVYRQAPTKPPRFTFAFDENTPLKDLLPTPPSRAEPKAPWLVKDLGEVVEVELHKPVQPVIRQRESDSALETMRLTAHVLAKINYLNSKGSDHFLRVLANHRPDLAGLPFVLDNGCRMTHERSVQFLKEVTSLRSGLRSMAEVMGDSVSAKAYSLFFELHENMRIEDRNKKNEPHSNETEPARIAALMQLLATAPIEARVALVRYLSAIEHRDATRALAKLAIFSLEEEIRSEAVTSLQNRPPDDSRDALFEGLRYPWPAVTANAGAAIVKLKRVDLIPRLVSFLDEDDPRAPIKQKSSGGPSILREVVRINHHRNCALCHSPGNSDDARIDDFGQSKDFITGAIPTPGQELPVPSQYYSGPSPDIIVRADVTYLRQDFSLMQNVDNAHPWPDMQRFDFVLRTRELSAKEMVAYDDWRKKLGPDHLSPNHQAALSALRQLTGLDAPPHAAAWRNVLRFGTER